MDPKASETHYTTAPHSGYIGYILTPGALTLLRFVSSDSSDSV